MQNSFTVYMKYHLLFEGFSHFAGVIISSVPFQNYIYIVFVTVFNLRFCILYKFVLSNAFRTLEQYCMESADGTDTRCLFLGRNP